MGYFNRLDKAANLMTGMADRLGAKVFDTSAVPTEMDANNYRGLILKCASCEHHDECQALQADHDRLAKAPAYCLNRATMERSKHN